ncbi:DNA polymerase III subunit beta [Rheinheimera sp.]|uniref:DNA polymerase III subunit beta n=1 Tax=Rheinheimera sp. TaxID=1869214 RepID=UPI0040477A02
MVQKFDIAISDALASLLPIATFASTERAVNEIYKHVLMRCDGNKCFAIASNGAQTIIRSIPMPLLGSEPFAVCIDGVKLRAILSSLKDASESEISISWTDGLATIKIGRSKLTASVVDASTYPETEKLGEEHSSLIIPGSILHQSLRSVSHSCAIRDARHYLNGCHFAFTASGFSVTGSDGHRLSRVCKNLTLNPSANAA